MLEILSLILAFQMSIPSMEPPPPLDGGNGGSGVVIVRWKFQ